VVLVTLAILAGLGFGLIRPQYNSLKRLAGDKVKAEKKYQQMQEAVKHADQLVAELNWAKTALGTMEKDVASGDLYSWVISTLRAFKVPYQVDLPSFSPIGPRSPMSLIPNFPYEQASITVAGRAHFHDFGRFVADFENQFPHIRVLTLDLDRDPFFPLSTSVYTRYGAVAAQTNRVAMVADLKLQGFSGPNEHRLAIINNRTFEVSEEADVSTSSGRVRIRCLEIKNESVVVQF